MALDPMYRGDSCIWQLTSDANLNGSHIWLIIKARETDSDSEALINREWTLNQVVNGQYTGAIIELLPTETKDFPIANVFVGVEFVSMDNRNYVILVDTVLILRDLRIAVG